MKKAKNIFLTTLGATKNRLDIHYYSCETANGSYVYTTGVSTAEAGIRYILSSQKIDEVIVIGSPSSIRENASKEAPLSDVSLYGVSDLDNMSEYDFLFYRIQEYIKQMDIELLDLAEAVSDARKNELLDRLNHFRKSAVNTTDSRDFFGKLSTNPEFTQKYKDQILFDAEKAEENWLKYYIYNEMDSFYRMHILDENKDTLIKYIPIAIDGTLSMEDIRNIVNTTLNDHHGSINLCMDIQGLSAIDGKTLITTFLLMNRRIGYSCDVCGLINSYMDPEAFSGMITNVLRSYEIQNLISGIDVFLEYGKVDLLKSYWNSLHVSDPDSNRLFYGMDAIDEGIALCNVDLIECGINIIRQVMKHPKCAPEDRNIYMDIIMSAISSDYGPLLKGDDLSIAELLKWSLRKGLYQQTLTIIESKVPGDIVKRGIYYYARNEEDIKAFMKDLNYLYWNESAKMRWAFSDIDHFFIKSYGRSFVDFRQKPDIVARDLAKLRLDALHGRNENLLPAYSELNNDDLLFELLLGYYRIGNLRNQVNHAIVEEVNPDTDELAPRKDSRTELNLELKKFIGLYSSACNKTQKEHEPVLLSPAKMKSYSRNHQLIALEGSSEDIAKSTYTCTFNGKEVQINISLFKPEEDIYE